MSPYRAAAIAASLLFALAAAADDGGVEPDDARNAPASAPAALPEIDDAAARSAAERARHEVETARERLNRANAAYSQMRARDYPRGDARAAVVRERDEARRDYEAANARYAEILEQLKQGR